MLKLTTGCSVEVTGKIVESPAQGQDFELAATDVKVVGWVEDAETYPMAKLVTLSSTYVKLRTYVRALT